MRKVGLQLFYKAIKDYQEKKSLNLSTKIQNRYSQKILQNYHKWKNCPIPKNPIIGGIDLSFPKKTDNLIIAGIVIIDLNLNILEKEFIITKTEFPYIPGYLSFRELGAIISLMEKITIKPSILCFDGQGIAHPRFLGIATHGGILLDIPSIGIGKSKLIGYYKEPEIKKGSKSKLIYQHRQVGWVLRSRTNAKPIFISPGWKLGMDYLPEFILSLCKYRIPEPTRLAHNFVNEVKKHYL